MPVSSRVRRCLEEISSLTIQKGEEEEEKQKCDYKDGKVLRKKKPFLFLFFSSS